MRKIIHVDMDAFFASVEQRDDPALQGKPVVVGGRPEQRGVVAACSYEARQFGVHSAMPSSRALKLCPNAVFLSARFDAYREASKAIHAVFREFTKLIEPLSLDEAYLDVTDLAQHSDSATAIAQEIKGEIKRRVNLTASAGVSYNKFLAKLASDMDKPNGLTVIRPEQAYGLIKQLPIRKFHGIGKVTERKMQALGIHSGKDLQALTKLQLQTQFGRAGAYYYAISRGIDERPVQPDRQRKSIGSETTFVDNVVDKQYIWQTVKGLTHSVADSLIKRQLKARTITLKVRYADFAIITRSQTVDHPIQSVNQILNLLPALFKKTDVGTRAIRLIGVSVANLQVTDNTAKRRADNSFEPNQQLNKSEQLGLFESKRS